MRRDVHVGRGPPAVAGFDMLSVGGRGQVRGMWVEMGM